MVVPLVSLKGTDSCLFLAEAGEHRREMTCMTKGICFFFQPVLGRAERIDPRAGFGHGDLLILEIAVGARKTEVGKHEARKSHKHSVPPPEDKKRSFWPVFLQLSCDLMVQARLCQATIDCPSPMKRKEASPFHGSTWGAVAQVREVAAHEKPSARSRLLLLPEVQDRQLRSLFSSTLPQRPAVPEKKKECNLAI